MGFLDQVKAQQAANPNPQTPAAPAGNAPPPERKDATGRAPAANRYEGIKPRAARAPFFKKGVHKCECVFTKMFSSLQSGDKFKLEFKIIESTNPAHPPGSTAAIVEDITPGEALTRNGGGERVKGYIVSMAGCEDEDTARRKFPGAFDDLVNAAHGYTERADGTPNMFAQPGPDGSPVSNPFGGEKYLVRANPVVYGPKSQKVLKDPSLLGQVIRTATGEEVCRYEIMAVRE